MAVDATFHATERQQECNEKQSGFLLKHTRKRTGNCAGVAPGEGISYLTCAIARLILAIAHVR